MEISWHRLIKSGHKILIVKLPELDLNSIKKLDPRLILDSDKLEIRAPNRKLEMDRNSMMNLLGLGNESKLLELLDSQLRRRDQFMLMRSGIKILGLKTNSHLDLTKMVLEHDPDICYLRKSQGWMRIVPIWSSIRLLDGMLAEFVIQEYNQELKLARMDSDEIPHSLAEQINLKIVTK